MRRRRRGGGVEEEEKEEEKENDVEKEEDEKWTRTIYRNDFGKINHNQILSKILIGIIYLSPPHTIQVETCIP